MYYFQDFRDIYLFISRRNPGIEYDRLHEKVLYGYIASYVCLVANAWIVDYTLIGKEMGKRFYGSWKPILMLSRRACYTVHACTYVPCTPFHQDVYKY